MSRLILTLLAPTLLIFGGSPAFPQPDCPGLGPTPAEVDRTYALVLRELVAANADSGAGEIDYWVKGHRRVVDERRLEPVQQLHQRRTGRLVSAAIIRYAAVNFDAAVRRPDPDLTRAVTEYLRRQRARAD